MDMIAAEPFIQWQLSLGNIATIITLIGIAVTFGRRLGHTETVLLNHSRRLDLYEVRLTEATGHLQRLIGRMEATQNRLEQVTGHRRGQNGQQDH